MCVSLGYCTLYDISRKWYHISHCQSLITEPHVPCTGVLFRVVFPTQSLVVLDFLIKSGSERVTVQCKENMFSIQTLKDFQYMDKDGKDQGSTGVWCV